MTTQQLELEYLDTPLLNFSPVDAWTIRDAIEGTHIFGAIGSGKTSGSGAAIALSFLSAGFGGLVLTASSEDRKMWEGYAAKTGRTNSLIVVSPDTEWAFNFLDYELRRPSAGAGFTRNAVALFIAVLEVSEGGKSGNEEGTWKQGVETLIGRAIDLCNLGHGSVSLQLLFDIIRTAPQKREDVGDERWQSHSTCFALITAADQKEKDKDQTEDFRQTMSYWLEDFAGTPEKMRGSYVGMFLNMADKLLTRPVREMFCGNTNLVPELTHEGAIIILDLPVEEYGETGQFCQALFKYVWQRASAQRKMNSATRPCFLWADEAQYFISSYDRKFQAAARRHRVATVYLSQNLPGYYAQLGEGTGKSATDALLGNLVTKIFHANQCHITNSWAADTISKDTTYRGNFGTGDNTSGPHTNIGMSENIDYQLQPIEFTTLRKGGPKNELCVDAVILQGGRIWEFNGKTWLKTTFHQENI